MSPTASQTKIPFDPLMSLALSSGRLHTTQTMARSHTVQYVSQGIHACQNSLPTAEAVDTSLCVSMASAECREFWQGREWTRTALPSTLEGGCTEWGLRASCTATRRPCCTQYTPLLHTRHPTQVFLDVLDILENARQEQPRRLLLSLLRAESPGMSLC
jgi:hypothetical protein